MEQSPLQRALARAPERLVARTTRPDEEYFLFRVGDLRVGVASHLVREVTRMGPLTPVPRSPSFLLGVVGHRGEVIPVVDMLRFLERGEARVLPRGRLLISAQGDVVAGVLAEQVMGLRRILLADKLPPPGGLGDAAQFITGVVQTRDLGTVNLLDLERVVQGARRKAVAR